MKCQNCGAEVTGRFCEFCGTRITPEMLSEQERFNKKGCPKCRSTNISFRRENQSEVRGKYSKSIVHRTVGLCKDCGYTWYTDAPTQPTKKKRRTWLWVLGWLCIFPVPLTILMLRKKHLNPIVKYGVIAAGWLLFLIIGMSGNADSNTANTPNETKVSAPTSSSVSVEPTTNTESPINNQVTEAPAVQEEVSTEPTYIRDETLNGHGRSDAGRSEPQYVGVIGYAVDYNNSGLHENDKFAETPWTVPIYEKDKQFYVECGTIDHKTEVVVLSQELSHERYGAYSGYLTVKNTQTGEEYIINVSNFITKPYWTYSPFEAVMVGNYVAEYHQVSDYWPVNKSNEKVELDDGFIVLAIGKTGLYGKNGPDDDTNQIEAVVFKDWLYGYGGVSVYFNKADLTIIY